MNSIKVLDKEFKVSLPYHEIHERVKQIAVEINEEYEGRNPIFLSVLNGAFMFTADLMKHVNIECEIQFIRMQSYEGMNTTGNVKTVLGVGDEINGRHLIVIEDIVDTGNTIVELMDQLGERSPASIKICSLLMKPEKYTKDIPVDYVGFNIPNDFILGYGLDYDGKGRNLKDIYTVVE